MWAMAGVSVLKAAVVRQRHRRATERSVSVAAVIPNASGERISDG